ncbi:MAG TPA: hypothetical protein PKN62_02040 [bacterium]|nr:hypothetical protein [bacterium]
MKLKHYLISTSIAAIIAWLLWLFILFRVDPFATNWFGRGLFYLTLFTAIFSTMALLGFVGRFSLIRQKLAGHAVVTAFRQSGLLAIGLVITLWLLSKQLFSWFNVLILAIGLAMLEFFLLSCHSEEHCPMVEKPKPDTDGQIISSTFNDETDLEDNKQE